MFTPEYQLLVHDRNALKVSVSERRQLECIMAVEALSRGNSSHWVSVQRDLGTLTPLATEHPGTIWHLAQTYTSLPTVCDIGVASCAAPRGSTGGPEQPVTTSNSHRAHCLSPSLDTCTLTFFLMYFVYFKKKNTLQSCGSDGYDFLWSHGSRDLS